MRVTAIIGDEIYNVRAVFVTPKIARWAVKNLGATSGRVIGPAKYKHQTVCYEVDGDKVKRSVLP
jgi:hypothetical protein